MRPLVDAVAQVLRDDPARRPAAERLFPAEFADYWRDALAPACARAGLIRTAADIARGITSSHARGAVLIEIAELAAPAEPGLAAALANEAEQLVASGRVTASASAPDGRPPGAACAVVSDLVALADALSLFRPALAAQLAANAAWLTDSLGDRLPHDGVRESALVRVLSRTADGPEAAADAHRRADRAGVGLNLRVDDIRGALAGGRLDDARQLLREALDEGDPLFAECAALLAAAWDDTEEGDGAGLRAATVGLLAGRALLSMSEVASLTTLLRRCPPEERSTAEAGADCLYAQFERELQIGGLRGSSVAAWTEAAVVLVKLRPEAARAIAQAVLAHMAEVPDVTRLPDRPATAVAGAFQVLAHTGSLAPVREALESLAGGEDGEGGSDEERKAVLWCGAARGALAIAPDWAHALAREAAALMRGYRGALGSMGLDFGGIRPEPVLDCVSAAAQALAVLGERDAARSLVRAAVTNPLQQGKTWSLTAYGLRAGDEGIADPACGWVLAQALVNQDWRSVLPLVGERDPELLIPVAEGVLTRACGMRRGDTTTR
jgi:hypothetical protein